MTFEELKAMDDTYIMHTYARFPVDIDHGRGATLYSLAGKEYIDFTSGIGVNSLYEIVVVAVLYFFVDVG